MALLNTFTKPVNDGEMGGIDPAKVEAFLKDPSGINPYANPDGSGGGSTGVGKDTKWIDTFIAIHGGDPVNPLDDPSIDGKDGGFDPAKDPNGDLILTTDAIPNAELSEMSKLVEPEWEPHFANGGAEGQGFVWFIVIAALVVLGAACDGCGGSSGGDSKGGTPTENVSKTEAGKAFNDIMGINGGGSEEPSKAPTDDQTALKKAMQEGLKKQLNGPQYLTNPDDPSYTGNSDLAHPSDVLDALTGGNKKVPGGLGLDTDLLNKMFGGGFSDTDSKLDDIFTWNSKSPDGKSGGSVLSTFDEMLKDFGLDPLDQGFLNTASLFDNFVEMHPELFQTGPDDGMLIWHGDIDTTVHEAALLKQFLEH